MGTKCVTLFQETRTVTGRKNTRQVGIFGKCKPIKNMRIKAKAISALLKHILIQFSVPS